MNRRAAPLPAAIAALALALSACASGSSEPAGSTAPESTTSSPGTTSAVPSRTTAPTPDPDTPTTKAPEPDRIDARRTVTSAGPGATYLGIVGGLVVVATPRGLEAYRAGRDAVWRFAAPRGDGDPETWLLPGAGVAVLARDVPTTRDVPFPGRTQVRVVDAISGELLWSDDDASFVSAGEATVLTTGNCTGEQEDFVGDCTISARDPRSGAVRWSAPTYASVMVAAYLDGAVAVDSYATGGGDVRTRVFDLASGAPRSPFVDARATAVADGFVVTGGTDEDPSDGCTARVRRLDLDGDVVWDRTLRVGRNQSLDSRPCLDYGSEAVPGGFLAVTAYGGRAWLLDPGTGTTRWRGEPDQQPDRVDDGLLVALSTSNGYLETVDGIDLRTGRTRWSFEPSEDVVETPGLVDVGHGRVVVSYDDCYDPCDTLVLDRRTGDLVATMRGALVATGPEGFVTASIDSAPVTFRIHRIG